MPTFQKLDEFQPFWTISFEQFELSVLFVCLELEICTGEISNSFGGSWNDICDLSEGSCRMIRFSIDLIRSWVRTALFLPITLLGTIDPVF